MDKQAQENSKVEFGQSGQKIEGNQINIAGGVTVQSRTLYGFMFGVLALVALVVIALTTWGDRNGTPAAETTPSAADATRAPVLSATPGLETAPTIGASTDSATPAADASVSEKAEGGCLAAYRDKFPAENVWEMEEGLRDLNWRRPDDDVLILWLTEKRQPIGLVHLLLFPEAKNFKIETILDAACQPVAPRGRDTFVSWDVFEFDLADVHYGIRVGYYSDSSLRSGGLRHME
ncbi:MAG: hypothetical protein H6641_19330 [Caldilineaceae bacterium]|nr:hypothetical protein [Caldilineaceae bacterium]